MLLQPASQEGTNAICLVERILFGGMMMIHASFGQTGKRERRPLPGMMLFRTARNTPGF
jgi:hypothetical protein